MADAPDRTNRAEVKAELAALGQGLHPEATLSFVDPPSREDAEKGAPVIILDRVSDEKPDYCLHGYAECIACRHLCFLGHESSEIVSSTEAYPLCMECAVKYIPEGTEPVRNIEDHKRADGPHE